MLFKVYLAGPEVFLPNAREVLVEKADIVRSAGLVPLCPGDLDIPPADTRFGKGVAISAANEAMMREADAMIANLTPFRGIAADVGTAFEVGYMRALGKRIHAYTNVSDLHFERCMAYYGGHTAMDEHGDCRGQDGLLIEDFDMADNLMLDGGVTSSGGTFVIGSAPSGATLDDLGAFRTCVEVIVEGLSDTRIACSRAVGA